VPTLGHPVRYSKTPVSINRGAPMYGENTREVLMENGYSVVQIDEFLSQSIIACA